MLPSFKEKAKGVHPHQATITRNVKGSSLRKRKIKNMNNKMAVNINLSTMTLNAKGLNAPSKDTWHLKRQQNKTLTYCMLHARASLHIKRHTQTESKGMDKDTSRKWKLKKKKAGAVILIPDKIDFKTETMKDTSILLLGIFQKKLKH